MKCNKLLAATVISLASLALSGCATIGNESLDNVQNYLQLREHASTKTDVFGIFGQPHDVRPLKTDGVVWVYYKIHIRPSAWSFVPIVGLAASGSQRSTTFSYFAFDANGTLEKIETKSDSGYENDWASIARALNYGSAKSPAERVEKEMLAVGKPFDSKLAHSVSESRDN